MTPQASKVAPKSVYLYMYSEMKRKLNRAVVKF